ncbi:MAG: hypothetical protein A2958_01535 [Candidatus Levybacteria bacterium RIFCSPLOWO2_01_FULL_38_13]|nr:MAG: hypothetical protein A2629_01535 [Candidatus Levybacteria bacterium RIFCSPHIGHO2_01_FULL_41_15]OGH34631.1 MAG: hypothetical protein A2958_01535 [Candidatus Levybacteria bacterium RIFCSPLOWO2_01_FULL_38_13]
MEDQGDTKTPGISPAEGVTPPKENEFVQIMNSLEALNTEGRRVVDVVPPDTERGLPKTIVIPAMVEGSRRGAIFLTDKGVFIDQDGLIFGQLQDVKSSLDALADPLTRKRLPQRQWDEDVFTSWRRIIDIEVESNLTLKGDDNGERMKRYFSQIYGQPDRNFARATPEELRRSVDESRIRASIRKADPVATPNPSDYTRALK